MRTVVVYIFLNIPVTENGSLNWYFIHEPERTSTLADLWRPKNFYLCTLNIKKNYKVIYSK